MGSRSSQRRSDQGAHPVGAQPYRLETWHRDGRMGSMPAARAQGSVTPRAPQTVRTPAPRAPQAARTPAACAQSTDGCAPAASGASQKRYIPALDGLRAFAVIAVILYHLGVNWSQSGLLGVTIFFVLSGYLITGLLIKEHDETGRIDLLHFWMRRVRRLVPAIIVLIVAVALLCALFNHVLLTKMRPDIAPSLFFYSNWWYIFRDLSYFEALGAPSPLTHFWSLAIEEQFYLVWPVLLLIAFKLGANKKVIRRGCLVLAVASAVLMAVLYDPMGDPSRVYYGTDTRAMSLLVGAFLAFVWPGQQFTEQSTSRVPRSTIWLLDGPAIAALAAIVVIMVAVSGMSPFLYYGGIFLVSVLTAVVIAAIVHPRSLLARFAQVRPFVWIGKRSYGMYLWHFPIIQLLAPTVNHVGGYPWWFIVLVFALTFVVSGLSYTFIEKPIRGGAIGRLMEKVKSGQTSYAGFLRSHLIPTLACLVFVLAAVVGCSVVPDTSAVPEDAIVSTGEAAGHGMDAAAKQQEKASQQIEAVNAAQESAAAESSADAAAASASTEAAAASAAAAPSGTARHEEGKSNPLLIGDSVPGDAQEDFDAQFPYGLMDSYIGRNFGQAIDVYQDYAGQGVVGHVVIIANFSNHMIDAGQLDEMIGDIGEGHEIYLVNIVVPDDWMGEANDIIAAAAESHGNVHLIDWASTCAGHEDEYLYDDLTHLRPTGGHVYMQMIRDAVTPSMPAEDLG